MDLFAFVKPKNELESRPEEQTNVPFVPEEMGQNALSAALCSLQQIWKKTSVSAQSAVIISE